MFNGIEVRRIRGQIFEGMSGVKQSLLNILSFVESGIVHDHHGAWREFGQAFLYRPSMENITVDGALKETHCESGGAQ